MTRSVIVSAVRTPFGNFQGALRAQSAMALGGTAIEAAITRAGVAKNEVDGVYMGMALQAGQGQNPSRQAARLAGLTWETPSLTVNKSCASGMRSITLTDALIRAGDLQVAVAGGMESASNTPHALQGVRQGLQEGHLPLLDLMLVDGLTCAFHAVHMAEHGSEAAKAYGVTREEQDAFALRSHQRALLARNKGRLADELIPVPVKNAASAREIESDEAPKTDMTLRSLANLSPVCETKGTVTVGNAASVNDGAAALVVMEENYAVQGGHKPLARILASTEVGTEASQLAIAPALAIRRLLQKTGLTLAHIDLFEIHELFAAVPLVCGKMLEYETQKVNVNGGALAYGHPIGASGARIVTTLVHELRRRGGGLGIAAICSGAAQGDAVLLEVYGE
ncbi:acetyl-CoA C-acetyltransferase [Alicyclobacillus fodiniaquatilis]|uniref:acetyl-CoA C-acetyltransferase n=1 Tax=Alicyclobacillus fodiniaquatilis TaxID=1661150 RepID=A0ABW4JJ84_9BACL